MLRESGRELILGLLLWRRALGGMRQLAGLLGRGRGAFLLGNSAQREKRRKKQQAGGRAENQGTKGYTTSEWSCGRMIHESGPPGFGLVPFQLFEASIARTPRSEGAGQPFPGDLLR